MELRKQIASPQETLSTGAALVSRMSEIWQRAILLLCLPLYPKTLLEAISRRVRAQDEAEFLELAQGESQRAF